MPVEAQGHEEKHGRRKPKFFVSPVFVVHDRFSVSPVCRKLQLWYNVQANPSNSVEVVRRKPGVLVVPAHS
jgi:hypothetical protein